MAKGNPCLEKLLGKMTDAQFPYCQNVKEYEKLAKIGQGTYGEVFKARHRVTGDMVALKKILTENEKEGFPITALREIRILKVLQHENIVKFIDVCRTNDGEFYLVTGFCEHDLAGLLCNREVIFRVGEIKMIMKHILNGLFFMHFNNILHRDLKAANILVTKSGTVKIADVGLSRAVSSRKRYTNKVITLWYRPAELLLGATEYGPAVDMWSAGCIMAELWTRSPIMQGETEQDQLACISRLCGSITPESFPGCEKLRLWKSLNLPQDQKRRLKKELKACVKDQLGLDLLDKLLNLDPATRIDADNSLIHDLFYTEPYPCELTKLLQPLDQSCFEYLQLKKRKNDDPCAGPSKAVSKGGEYDRVF